MRSDLMTREERERLRQVYAELPSNNSPLIIRLLDALDAAERELERWRHGVTIEGDFVCPNDLRAANAERERDKLYEELTEARALIDFYRKFREEK